MITGVVLQVLLRIGEIGAASWILYTDVWCFYCSSETKVERASCTRNFKSFLETKLITIVNSKKYVSSEMNNKHVIVMKVATDPRLEGRKEIYIYATYKRSV